MGKISIQSLFQVCLVIAGQSPTNLTINTYFIKKVLAERLQELSMNTDLTVDQIVDTPQKPIGVEDTLEEEVSVAIVNNKAYWIKNNHVYMSDINEYGDIDIKNARVIDAYKLSNKEMNSLLKIIDSLN